MESEDDKTRLSAALAIIKNVPKPPWGETDPDQLAWRWEIDAKEEVRQREKAEFMASQPAVTQMDKLAASMH